MEGRPLYGFLLYVFFICLLKISWTRGLWLLRWRHIALFSLCGVIMAEYRSNGYPALILCTLSLASLKRLRWAGFAAICAFVISTMMLFNALSTTALAPPRFNFWPSGKSIPLHLMAKHQTMNRTTTSETEFLQSLKPNNLHYICVSSAPLMFTEPFVNVFEIHYGSRELIQVFMKYLWKFPWDYIRHIACGSRFIFDPTPSRVIYEIHHKIHGRLITPNNGAFGRDPQDDPKALQSILAQIYHWSKAEPLGTILWRPGFSLWALLFCFGFLALRLRSAHVVQPVILPLVHCVILIALAPNDHLRYVYPVLVILPATIAWSFLNIRKDHPVASASPSLAVHPQLLILSLVSLTAWMILRSMDHRPWRLQIFEGPTPQGRFLEDFRPKIDHRPGWVFQDARAHYLLYSSCLDVEADAQDLSFEATGSKKIDLLINGQYWDPNRSLHLTRGKWLVQIGYERPESRPSFSIQSATQKRFQLSRPTTTGC